MKTITITLGLVALAATLLAAPSQDPSSASCCGNMTAMHLQSSPDMAAKPFRAKIVKGVQTATIMIEGGQYIPSVISVVKGKPVALTFKSGKNPGCGSTVVFKSLKIKQVVPKNKSITIKFTPKAAGDIAFTCSMDMYDGKVIVK